MMWMLRESNSIDLVGYVSCYKFSGNVFDSYE